MEFSVLLSVYHRELPEQLQQSLGSVFGQTLPPTEVVLVEDGPLTPQLDAVIARYQQSHAELKIVRLETNGGLGHALNEGLQHCTHDVVARMDTDDICRPERFELQVRYLEQHPEVDVLGGWIEEFEGDPSHVIATRRLPERHADIAAFSKKRNPMNHTSVMFRRQAVEAAGSYQDFPLFEDYDLWTRMLQHGAQFHNLQQPLVWMRTSHDYFARRGGQHYLQQELRLQRELCRRGYISWWRMAANMPARYIMRLLPNKWREKSYLFFLRK